ncbi:protoporphyrinogen/coproporphyrinogen oxidase [Actinokineospora sp.]|uniref:protoporphyrinogen/coproporphyrinogen oxidase n=1 Tax=Actinokineospora sp. TaxID=1872133 RepID=UPI003D6C6C25
MTADLDVAIVGAGIAGLSLAFRLRQAGRSVHVFESAAHVGGRMRSVRREGYLIDTGAEMIGTHGYPATWRLMRDLGMSEKDTPLIGGDLAMWREGRPHPHVGDPRGMVSGAGLTAAGRASLAKLMATTAARKRSFDVDRPERTPLGVTTVRDFARRHHPDVHDYLLQPLCGGFFGWDTDRAAAGPLLSHLLAVGPTRSFRTWRDGMDTLARTLASRVEVSTGVAVQEVTQTPECARLTVDGTVLTARQVVLCVPAPVAVDLHAGAPDFVRACEFQPMVKVVCLLDRPIDAGGASWAVEVPAVENPAFAGFILDDRKHPERVPAGRGMVTLFAGQSAGRLLERSNDEVVETLVRQAARYLPDLAAACRVSVVVRFRHGLPMPTAASLATREVFVRRPVSSIDYAGDWCVQRPSSEGAVRSAELVAQRIMADNPQAVLRG